jgi:methionyl-tRNA formyltransferase
VSDKSSWINTYIPELISKWQDSCHDVKWVHNVGDVDLGDCLFFLGSSQIASADILSRNSHNLVVHESALPMGKGWSPLTWQILEGKNEIPITLFEAVPGVDSGDIYLSDIMAFKGTELIEELRGIQAEKTLSLCQQFVRDFPNILSYAESQKGSATYYPSRDKKDSELNPDESLRDQFNLLRVVDNERYPAFFEINQKRFVLKIFPDEA